jgi:hypothetical protein
LRLAFLKYFGIAAGIQILVCTAIWLVVGMVPTLDFLFTALLYLYFPTTYLIWKIGNFSGESAIFGPILLGIPAGVLAYSVVFGLALTHLRKPK